MRKLFLILMLGGAICLCPETTEAQGFLKKAGEKLKKAKETISSIKNTAASAGVQDPSEAEDEQNESEEEYDASEAIPFYPDLVKGKLYENFSDSEDNKQYLPRTTANTVTIPVKGNPYYYSDFNDGVALIQESFDSEPYFINTRGEKLNIKFDVKPLHYDEYYAYPKFYKGRTIIKHGDEWSIVDKNGTVIKTLPGKIVKATGFTNGIGIVVSEPESFKWQVRYIDTNGNNIYPMLGFTVHANMLPKLGDMIRPTSDGLTAVCKQIQNGNWTVWAWGFADTKGNLKIPATYHDVHDFHNGLAAVQEFRKGGASGGKWGFIDTNGNVVLDFKYDKPTDFNGDYALVKTGYSEKAMIDRSGNVVGKVLSSEGFIPIADGYALLSQLEGSHVVQYLVKGHKKEKVAYAVDGRIQTVEYDPVEGKYYQDKYCSGNCASTFGWLDLHTLTTKLMRLRGFFRDGIAKAEHGYVNEDGVYIIKFDYGH